MKCEECTFESEETGSCMNDSVEENEIGTENCKGFKQKTPQLNPEDMFKTLYMMIYLSGGEISISKSSFGQVPEDAKILPSYDPKTDRFILETSEKPKPPKRKRGIIKPSGKLIIPERLRN